jgi:hypothetical protein
MSEACVWLLKVKTNDLSIVGRAKVRNSILGRLIYSSLNPCYYSPGLLDSIKFIRVGSDYVCERRF